MFNKEREPDTLKQNRTRHYVNIIVGAYLIYTAYSIVKDMHSGVPADRPILFYGAAALFSIVGAVLCITSVRATMKNSAAESEQVEEADEDKDVDTTGEE